MATIWMTRAAEAVSAGYTPSHEWENMLRRHLMRLFPELVKEFGDDLEPYLQVMTHNALELEERLRNEGTNPETARELAMADLLPVPPDEQDKPEPWEIEDAEASMMDAAMKFLTRPQ